MKTISRDEPKATSNFWYDLFDGGYINPEDFLKKEKDIIKVKEAMLILKKYKNTLFDNEVVEDM